VAADAPLRRPGGRRDTAAGPGGGRRPKQLERAPALFEPAPGGQGGLVLVGGPRGRARAGGPPPDTAPATTGEQGAVVVPPAERDGGDPLVRGRARQIAARLAVPRPRRDPTDRRGAGELASVRYREGSDDIDLDRTLEVLAERPVPDDQDIIVKERVRTRRAVVLAVDLSGSMRGERVRTAAAAVGALAAELVRDDLAVVAFWSDAAILLRLGQRIEPLRLLDQLLAIPAKGLTNVGFALQVGLRELARLPARDARVVLLSDCVHNAGADPLPVAARLPRLDVLLDVGGEHDLELARDLARRGRGRLARVRHHRDVAPALGKAFAR
jgi:Mg-chelatase subunit ChlD